MFCLIAGAVSLTAQEVQVTNLKVASDNKITFDVSWGARSGAWSDTVWVFIDYFNMDKQEMWRLPVTSATLTNTSWAGAKVRMISDNNAGFYIEGDAREASAFTATVSVTPEGTYPQGVIRPCVYVTDHQPIATYGLSGDVVTASLTGTAPYSGKYSGGSAWTSPTGTTFNVPSGQYISSFADATGNKGEVRCGTGGSSVTIHPSSAAYQNQVVCKNDAITGTSYTIGGSATSCTVADLPAGLTAAMSGKVVRISGTPTASGTYTITTIGHTEPCTAATITGTVKIDPVSVGGTITGSNTICLGGTSGSLTLSDHVGTVQKWQSSTDGSNWDDITNTAISYLPGSPTTTTYYHAVVKSGVCAVANSTPATVTVTPVPGAAGAITGIATICQGQTSVTYSVAAVTGATSYTWAVPAGATITAGQNTTGITVSYGASQSNGTITVTPRNCSGNGTAKSLDITANPTTKGGSVTPDKIIDAGEAVGILTLSGHVGTVQKWQLSVNSGTWSDIPNAAETYSPGVLSAEGTYAYRAVVKSGVCAVANSTPATIKVNTIIGLCPKFDPGIIGDEACKEFKGGTIGQ